MADMRTVLFAVIAFLLVAAGASGLPGVARAQGGEKGKGKQEVEAKTNLAMENFDLLEFETAKRQLGEAAALAKKHKLDDEPVLARVYLNLGIVEFAGLKNKEAALLAFAAAVAIDPKVEIGVAYRTEAMQQLLATARKGAPGGLRERPPEPAGGEREECGDIDGVEHALVEQSRSQRSQLITARVSDAAGADKVSLFYRRAGSEKYSELPMQRGPNCTYEAAIPPSVMQGEAVHYYVAAVKRGQVVASKGSRISPNIISLDAAGGGAGEPAAEVSRTDGPRARLGKKKTVFLSLAAGTGGGYVSGSTEVAGSDVDCCFAPALFHVFPEFGFYFTRRLSLSAAFRLGFAIGANVMGHATQAPSGVLRLRYALDESGDGFQISGAAGGGIIRHTVKVEQAADGMDTDTTASGPFLVGGGLGYIMPINSVMRLVAELNALAAIPGGIEEIGPCPGSGCVRPQFAVQMDLNLGVLFAF
jgi:hypothetical protein